MAVSFAILWSKHPSNRGEDAPCKKKDDTPAFENQCAIRMGVCLKDGGINLSSFRGARCWFGHSHIIRAQELANWLKSQSGQFGKVEIKKKATWADYQNRKGIVFLMNFWGVGNQGDHIDLWDGSRMAHGDLSYFSRAQEVWFWPIS